MSGKITESAFVIFIIASLQACFSVSSPVQYREDPKPEKPDIIYTIDAKTNKLRPALQKEIEYIAIEITEKLGKDVVLVTPVAAIPTINGCFAVASRPPKYAVKNGKVVDKKWIIRAPKNQPIIIFLMINENGFTTYSGSVRIWKNNKPIKTQVEGPEETLEFGWYYLLDSKKPPKYRCNGYSPKNGYLPTNK